MFQSSAPEPMAIIRSWTLQVTAAMSLMGCRQNTVERFATQGRVSTLPRCSAQMPCLLRLMPSLPGALTEFAAWRFFVSLGIRGCNTGSHTPVCARHLRRLQRKYEAARKSGTTRTLLILW